MTRPFRLACAAAVVALALPLAACGGGGGDDTGGADSSARADNAQNTAQTKMLACLKDQGIDVGGAQNADNPPSQAQREKIMDALNGPCKKYRTALGASDPQQQQELRDEATKLANCLQGKGVDMPSGDVVSALAKLDRNDPKTSRAIDECAGLESLRQKAGGS
jgi:hypothetical protein